MSAATPTNNAQAAKICHQCRNDTRVVRPGPACPLCFWDFPMYGVPSPQGLSDVTTPFA
ncbi:hypothetical protein W02_02390 [Nitrospira sp. KM1]|nr:hypothetical protein W02_02390 [Nitrospira sp. KM1]